MENITVNRTGNKLVIEVDLSKSIGPSKSGKTVLVASTQGNAAVPGPGGFKMGLNLFSKPTA